MLARILALALAIYPALAFAQSSPILGFPPGVFQNRAAIDKSPSGPSFSLTLQSSNGIASSGGSTSIDFGTLSYAAGATRTLVALQWITSTSITVSSVTIGGVALVQVPGAFVTGGAFAGGLDLWETTSSLSGSSGDVQVTYSAVVSFGAAAAVYSLVTTTPTVSAVNSISATGPPVSLAITVPSGGTAIVQSSTENAQAITFTNATLDVNVPISGGGSFFFAHTTATGSVTVTSNYTSTSNDVMSLAAWGP
jgi:hypothetical protein